MPMRCNSPSPVDDHTTAPVKITVRTAPRKPPRTQEYSEFPRIPRGAGSLASGVPSIMACLPNNFSVEQAETHCPHSFLSRTQPPLPKDIHGTELLQFPHAHDR